MTAKSKAITMRFPAINDVDRPLGDKINAATIRGSIVRNAGKTRAI
jgi:hypothetical protein